MLSIGDTLLLESLSQEKEIFRSKVIDIHKNSFFIGPPIKEKTNRTEPIIIENTPFRVQFVAKNQKVYKFQTKVINKQLENITKFEFELPEKDKFINIQRRSFIRVETQLKVKVFSLNNEFTPFDTYTTDISAGGLSIVLLNKETLEKGQVVICSLVLPLAEENVYLRQPSSVVRITDKISNQFASLKFEQMNEKDQQSLVRYCFERQVALRKKGL